MTIELSKAAAQQRADQIDAFHKELTVLNDEQILHLPIEQLEVIHQYHQKITEQLNRDFDIDVNQKGKNLTVGMQITSFLGAVALAASVFFLFYQYWGYFNTLTQVVILLAAPLLTLIASFLIREKEKTGYFSKLMALISFACFVLNLSMFGQIFNLAPTDNALAIWCAYALVLAYALDIRLLLAAAITCFYAFIAARVGEWYGIYWLSMGDHPETFILPALILFFIPSVFSHRQFHNFAAIYRVLSLCGLFLAILIMSHWGRSSFLPWDVSTIENFYQIAGFILAAGFMALGIKKAWLPVVNTANVFFVIFLYTKFYDWWWAWLPKYLFFFLIGITSVLFLLIFNRLRYQLKQGSSYHVSYDTGLDVRQDIKAGETA